MHNWLKQDLDFLIDSLKKDLDLISKKNFDDEWKRDHYRYTVTVMVQRIFELLNSSITIAPVSPLTDSTRKELLALNKIIYKILDTNI